MLGVGPVRIRHGLGTWLVTGLASPLTPKHPQSRYTLSATIVPVTIDESEVSIHLPPPVFDDLDYRYRRALRKLGFRLLLFAANEQQADAPADLPDPLGIADNMDGLTRLQRKQLRDAIPDGAECQPTRPEASWAAGR